MAYETKKIDAAKTLWTTGYTVEEVARILSITPGTVSKWKKDGEWDDHRARISSMQENTLTKLTAVFEYEVECLHREMSSRREEGKWEKFGNSNWDGVLKAYNVIKRDKMKFDDIIRVMMEWTEWVSARNLELAKSLTTYVDQYINEKSKLL